MHMFGVGLCLFCWITLAWADLSPLFLTPYIKNNTAAEGRNLSSVDPSQFLNTTSYSGYITVDEKYKSHLFFWYFPVANADVSETPLIIWLQGGPGGTSLLGTFLEIGPFVINGSGVLQSRPTSWGVNHSLLFIDSPVETGLSFSETIGGTKHYATNLDTCAEHLYSFLQQFLTVYPEVRAAPLYIAGESYAGRFVPAFAKKLYDNKETHNGARKINLQGLIMGNPLLNYIDTANISQIFYQWGLIDQQGLLSVKQLQEDYVAAIKNNASNAQELHENLLDRLQALSLHKQLYNVLEYGQLSVTLFEQYINSKDFKQKVHGADKDVPYVNRDVQRYLAKEFLLNMDSTMEFLLEHYRILIYCGQLDLTEPCVPNEEGRRRNWHWSRRSEFLKAHRLPITMSQSEVAGYFKSGGGLTEVLVSGAGHLVPIDKPKEAQLIVSFFIKAEEMPSRSEPLGFNDVPDLEINFKLNNSTQVSNNTRDNKSDTSTLNTIVHTVTTNPLNTFSWVLNGILIIVIVVCGVLYLRHKRRYRDYLLNDDDSLNNAMLTMS